MVLAISIWLHSWGDFANIKYPEDAFTCIKFTSCYMFNVLQFCLGKCENIVKICVHEIKQRNVKRFSPCPLILNIATDESSTKPATHWQPGIRLCKMGPTIGSL